MGIFTQDMRKIRHRRFSRFIEFLENRRLLANQSGLVLSLDGEDDYAPALDDPSLDLGDGEDADFTIEASFYVFDEKSRGKQTLVSKENAYQLSIDFDTSGKDVIFLNLWSLQNTQILSAETEIAAGWHHIAAVMDNESPPNEDRVALYLDGQRLRDSPDFITRIFNSDQPLQVGSFASKELFKGAIDEVRLSDSVRYAGPTYTVPSTPFTSDDDTRALWNFDQPRFDEMMGAEVFLDQSPHDNLLIAQNGATAGDPPGGDQKPLVALSLSAPILPESGTEAKVTATLSSPTDHDVTVDLAFAGNAVHPSDYTRDATTIVIPAGTLSGHLTLTSVDDPLHEGTETIVIEIANVSNAVEGETQQVSVGILDDDPTPTVRLSLSDSSVAEGAQAIVTATLSTVSYRDVIVDLEFGGSASHPDDYVRDATSIQVPAGLLSGILQLLATKDTVYESDETIVVGIAQVLNGTPSELDEVSLIIEGEDAPSLSLDISSFVSEGDSATLRGTIENPPGQPFIVEVDWGDEHQNIPLPAGKDSFVVSHVYLDDAPTGTAFDELEVLGRIVTGGSAIATATAKIEVTNVAPLVDAGNNASVKLGKDFSAVGAFSDPGTVDVFTGTVDYGDGSGTQPLLLNPDRTFDLTWTYRHPGFYPVQVTVSDDDRGVGNDLFVVTVIEPSSGAEFPVNSTLLGDQVNPSVAMDADGDYVIVWRGDEPRDKQGIFGQRYDSSGLEVGGEFRVNMNPNEEIEEPSVAMDADGDFVVGWFDNIDGSNDVFARRFHADGTPKGPQFLVTESVDGNQSSTQVAVDAEGNFVVAWHHEADDVEKHWDVAYRVFDADGIAITGELPVTDKTALEQFLAFDSLAMDTQGNFVVTWLHGKHGEIGWDVYARRFDVTGRPLTDEIHVNSITTSFQPDPAVVTTHDGGFAVTWEGASPQGKDDHGILVRRFDADGIPLGEGEGKEVLVNSHRDGIQKAPVVTTTNQGLAAVWNGVGADDEHGIWASRYDAGSDDWGPQFRVNSHVDGEQLRAAVASSTKGNWIAAWEGDGQFGREIFAQHFQCSSDILGPVVSEVNVGIGLQRIAADERLVQDVEQINVIFSEDVRLDTVTNSEHWSISRNGHVIEAGIADISYRFDPNARKYIVTARLDGNGNAPGTVAISDGQYSLTIRDAISDISGNALDGDYDGRAGGSFIRSFQIVPPEPLATATINTTIAGTSYDADIAMAADGSHLLAWTVAAGRDPQATDIYGRLYDVTGTPLGSDFRINTTVDGIQAGSDVAWGNGRYVTVWQGTGADGNSGVFGQILDAQGNKTEFSANQRNGGSRGDVGVDVSSDGRFWVVWSETGGESDQIYARRFEADGRAIDNKSELLVNSVSTPGDKNPSIAVDAHNNAFIVWESLDQDGSGWGIFGRRFAADGEALDAVEFRVNTRRAGDQQQASVASAANGQFVVTWTGRETANDRSEVFGQLFDASGNKIGTEFRVHDPNGFDNHHSAVSVDADGDFVVVWRVGETFGESVRVLAQRFSADGTRQGPVHEVADSTVTSSDAFDPGRATAVGVDGDGDFVVAWNGDTLDGTRGDVFARPFQASGSISGKVWNDINDDGINDDGEPGLEGRTVELRRVRTEIEMPTILSFPTSPAGPENSLHNVAAIGTEHVAVAGTVDGVETVYLFNAKTGERLLPEFASESEHDN